MTDRKAELAKMCRLEIRKTSAISKSRMSEYGYHLVEAVVDAEVEVMMERLTDKSVRSDDVPLLRELVFADLWPRLKTSHRDRREADFGKVIADFPEIVVHYADFAFDGGWIPLVRDEIEKWIRQDLDSSPVTHDDKAWLHGYVRAAIEEEYEGQMSTIADRGA